jgi:hypothetical protein
MEYKCDSCKYSTKHKHHFNRHLQTERHLKATTKPLLNSKSYSCSICSRNFKTRAGVWKHEKWCKDTPTILNKANKELIEGNKELIEAYKEIIEAYKEIIEGNNEMYEAQRRLIKQIIEFIVLRINVHDNEEEVNEIVRTVNDMGLQYKIGVTE